MPLFEVQYSDFKPVWFFFFTFSFTLSFSILSYLFCGDFSYEKAVNFAGQRTKAETAPGGKLFWQPAWYRGEMVVLQRTNTV
jgi:hypothetical protein